MPKFYSKFKSDDRIFIQKKLLDIINTNFNILYKNEPKHSLSDFLNNLFDINKNIYKFRLSTTGNNNISNQSLLKL